MSTLPFVRCFLVRRAALLAFRTEVLLIPLVSGTVVVLGTGTIYAGNVNLDPATWWRMTPSLNVSDGGKWGVLLNMPFGWEKWFRPFGPLGTPKGMDDLVCDCWWVVSPCWAKVAS